MNEAQSGQEQIAITRLERADNTLTDREVAVIRYIARGLSSKEIGKRLNTSNRTVESQIAAIKAKLGAKNVTHAVALFMGHSITEIINEILFADEE